MELNKTCTKCRKWPTYSGSNGFSESENCFCCRRPVVECICVSYRRFPTSDNFFIDTHQKWRELPEFLLVIAEEFTPNYTSEKVRILAELDYLKWLAGHEEVMRFIVSGERTVNAIIQRTKESMFNTIKAKMLDILDNLQPMDRRKNIAY